MSRRSWTPEDDAHLRELYPSRRTSELPALFGRSKLAIKVRAGNLHLRKDPGFSMRRQWHPDEDAVLRMIFPDTPTDAVAAVLDRSPSSTFQRARKLGSRKTAEYLACPDACRLRRGDNVGAAYRFQKGHVPPNKGLRRPGYAPGRMKETQFKKGQPSLNKRELGDLRLNADGYVDMKVCEEPGAHAWRALHVLLWEDEHGPVPAGHALCFKDGDRLNIELANIELISRADLARRNSIHNLPPALKGAITALATLKRKIRREEQNRGSAQSPLRHDRGSARRGEADGRGARQGGSRCRPGDRGFGKGREHVYGNHGQ